MFPFNDATTAELKKLEQKAIDACIKDDIRADDCQAIIGKGAENIDDWACDSGLDEDGELMLESNGGVEHLGYYRGHYYTYVTDWSNDVVYPGTIHKIDVEETIREGGFMADLIKKHKGMK